ncbi:MAG: hypothetical protein ACLRWA_10735 [Lachnospira sp.]
MYSYLYLLILPILVTLCHTQLLFSDVNDHLIEFICTRADKKRVFLCKIYGGIFIGRNCILCSAHFNILLCIAVVPVIKPQAADSTSMVPKELFCIAVYAPGSLCCDFIDGYILFSGALAVFALNVAFTPITFYGAVSAIGIKRCFYRHCSTAQFAVMGAV